MVTGKNDPTNSIGRRGFIKSLFGLGATVIEKTEADADARTRTGACIVWADLHTGFIGFPTGVGLRRGLPGSVMKLIAAAAMVEDGLVNPNERFDCKGHIDVNGKTFHCMFPHGHVDLTKAIAVSCNCYFIHNSHHVSTAQFLSFAKRLGLADLVGKIESGPFPEESHDPSYTFVIGLNETMQPSVVQLARLAALIATKGQLPYLHSADDMEPGEPFHATLKDATWHRLQQGMEMVVREGTAKKLDPENRMHIAAKTGTSEHGKKFQSCVIGYFPYTQPRNAFCVWAPTGTSQEAAVPEAHQFLFSTKW